MTDLAPIFLRAAEVIRTNGHYQGAYFEPSPESGGQRTPADCPVCAAGAISIAVTGTPIPGETEYMDRSMKDALLLLSGQIYSPVVGDPIERIADWNDNPARTPAEVIAALETAAQLAAVVQAVA